MASWEVSEVGNMLTVEDTRDSVLLRFFTYEERANVTKKSCRWIPGRGGDNSYFIMKISTTNKSYLYVLPVSGSDFERLVTTEDEFEPFCIQGVDYVAVVIDKNAKAKQEPMRDSFKNLMMLLFKSDTKGFTVTPFGDKIPVEITCDGNRIDPDGSSIAELTVRYDSFGTLILKTALPVYAQGKKIVFEKPNFPKSNEREFTTNLKPPITLIDWNFVDFQRQPDN